MNYKVQVNFRHRYHHCLGIHRSSARVFGCPFQRSIPPAFATMGNKGFNLVVVVFEVVASKKRPQVI